MKVDFHHYCSLAQLAIQQLMEKVVAPILDLERVGALSEKKRQELAKGKVCDVRPSLWCTTSGKGGRMVADSSKLTRSFDKEYRNVSLIDHSLSVANGAVAFAAVRLACDDIDSDRFKRLCFTIGLLGFFHDLNKRVGAIELHSKPVTDLLDQYEKALGLTGLLEQYGVQLSLDDILQLVCFVESGSSASAGVSMLPRDLIYVAENYIRLADNLDSIWCRLSNTKRPWGIEGVLQHLHKMADLIPSPFKAWHHIQLYNPHTPLLLDELLKAFSSHCKALTGFPPLLESHHDGRLDLLVPKETAQDIIEAGLNSLLALVQPQLSIVMSSAKTPTIKGVVPESVEKLLESVKENPQCVSDLLPFHKGDADLLTCHDRWMDGVYEPTALQQQGKGNQTFSLSLPDEDHPAFEAAALAATLRLLLSIPKGSAKTYLRQSVRQQQLLKLIESLSDEQVLPNCHSLISLQTVMAVYLANQMFSDEATDEIRGELWSLMQHWYEGDEEQLGIQPCLAATLNNEREVSAVEQLRQLLNGKMLGADSKGTFTQQTCLITGLPGEGRIEEADQLYGIKASAFSTRRGRPAVIGDGKGKTFVSDMGFVEYRLKAKYQGRSKNVDMPLLVSSPTMTGLFSGLRLKNDNFLSFATYDLVRETLGEKAVMVGPEIFNHRVRLARYEVFTGKLDEQIDFIRRIVIAVRRTGRPVHVFRGLPSSRSEILYIDFLPNTLKRLLGGKNSFVLEDLPQIQLQLNMARTVLQCCNQGHSLLRDILSGQPLSGLCVAKMSIEDRIQQNIKNKQFTENNEFRKGQTLLADRIQEARQSMSESEKTVLLFAAKAATLQKRFNVQSSRREQQLVLWLCLDTAKSCLVDGINDRDSIVRAIEGVLENKVLSDRYGGSKGYRTDSALATCEDIALFFVDRIWLKLLGGKPPSRRFNKTMTEMYRMEMLHIYQSRSDSRMTEEA